MVTAEATLRKQKLEFGLVSLAKEDRRDDQPPVLYFLAGRKLYVIGAQSGEYPRLGWRRTGFIVAKRVEEQRERAAHLVSEMGGIWAQPIKVLDGFYYSIEDEDSGERWDLRNSDAFTNHFSHAQFRFEDHGLEVRREDFVVEDEPALFSTLTIANKRTSSARFTLRLRTEVNIMPAWFAGLPDGRDVVSFLEEEGLVTGLDSRMPDRAAVVLGSPVVPVDHELGELNGKRTATLAYRFEIAPGEQLEAPFLFVAENQQGLRAARQRFRRLIGKHRQQLRKKIAAYHQTVFEGVRFQCSDREFSDAYYCAKANLQLLQAELPPPLGRYFFAGIPEYVQLFGTDTCYSVPGLAATGFAAAARDALDLLRGYADRQCGRVPHEVTTTGRVFDPGSPQETPQFAIACWNYFCWTGDREFLKAVYPLCKEALLDYVVAQWDADLDFFPDGQSMIERRGADEENVDSVCYFTRALYCLAEMAKALGEHDDASLYRDRYADVLRKALNEDFWIGDASIFADSLRADHTPRQDGYWTVVVPLETELAEAGKAESTLKTITEQEGWLQKEDGRILGLVHTRYREPTVWTLPTGILARVAFAMGHTELGLQLLRSIALAALSPGEYGTLGAFGELIPPKALCFIQLWSPAIFLQGIVEGLFGLHPWAHQDRVEVFPHPPSEWTFARLERVPVGDRELTVEWRREEGDIVRIAQHRGSRLNYVLRWWSKVPVRWPPKVSAAVAAEQKEVEHGWLIKLEFSLEPGGEVEVRFLAAV